MTNTKEISMNWPHLSTRPATRRRRSLRPNLEQVEGRQLLSNVYVLGTDGNLWIEAPGWQQNGRVLVDSNVQSFAADPREPGYLFVEGTDHNLWLESPGWQQHGRTWVDGNVQAFAVDPSASGHLYVEGTDHKLWLESPGWKHHGRTWVDGNVQTFAVDPSASGHLYVEGTNHKLWLESPGWRQHGRTWVDNNVQAFTADPQSPGSLYVEGTDHNLWLESPGWQQHGRTWVDSNVQAFAAAPELSVSLYVEGTDHNLWLESPGWQQQGRTLIDGDVQAFSDDPNVLTGFTLANQTSASGPATTVISDPTIFEDQIGQTWQGVLQGNQLIDGQTFQQLVAADVQNAAQQQDVRAYGISQSFASQGNYAASVDTSSPNPTLHMEYFLPNNTLVFTTTTNSIFGGFADPTFHVTFDMTIDVGLTLPSSLSSGSTVTTSASFAISNVTVSTQNVIAGVQSLFGTNVTQQIANQFNGFSQGLPGLVDTGALNTGLQLEAASGYTQLQAGLDSNGNLLLTADKPVRLPLPHRGLHTRLAGRMHVKLPRH
jgi:hypothetical protein